MTNRKVLLATAITALMSQLAQAQFLERVSVASNGAQANGPSALPALSPDARFVAFWSTASNLASNDANGASGDYFLRDRAAGTTVLVSIGNAGQQATQLSHVRAPHVSADGRYVLFLSNQLDPLDTDPKVDVYLRDVVAGTTTWITQTNDDRDFFSIGMSADGSRVMYEYFGLGTTSSVEVRDLISGQTWLLGGSSPSVAHDYSFCVLASDGGSIAYSHVYGKPALSNLTWRSRIEWLDLATGSVQTLLSGSLGTVPLDITADGRFVLYNTLGSTLLFRIDRLTLAREYIGVSEAPPSPHSVDGIASAAISDAGEYVAFTTDDTSILPGDTTSGNEAYVRVLPVAGTLRGALNLAGQQSNGTETHIDINGDGTLVVFDSDATNLVAGDTNSASDVFVRSVCGSFFADSDADGFGDAGAAQLMCVPVPAGVVLNAQDCNDANATIHPGANELCDGLDQDCDNSIDENVNAMVYCYVPVPGGPSCEPALSTSGCPSASAAGGFTLHLSGLRGQQTAMFFYGTSSSFVPWAPLNSSWMCVAAPRQRTTPQNSGGSAISCSGQLVLDFTAWATANPGALALPLVGGQALYFQAWYSDPLALGGSRLSEAVSVLLDP